MLETRRTKGIKCLIKSIQISSCLSETTSKLGQRIPSFISEFSSINIKLFIKTKLKGHSIWLTFLRLLLRTYLIKSSLFSFD